MMIDRKRNKNIWVNYKCKYDRTWNIDVDFKDALKCFIENIMKSNRMYRYGFYKGAVQFPFIVVFVLRTVDTQNP